MSIVLHDVCKSYGKKQVLDHIDLTIENGKCTALLGPSGCGKTTLLNALAGLIDIDSGSIRADDQVWANGRKGVSPEKRRIGMVFQDFALWPHMNVYDNVAFSLKLKKLPAEQIRKEVEQALITVQMQGSGRQYPHQLSGGQKQRVAIARALVAKPTLILMDEPLSSLDAQLREKMRWEILRIVVDTGITMVYVTHDQSEALSLAANIVLLNGGHIEQMGRPYEVYRAPKTSFSARFLGCSNLLDGMVLENSGNLSTVECSGIRLQVASNEKAGQKTKVAIRPSDILLNRKSAEPGTELSATIVQRSYQGLNWHYMAAVEGTEDVILEIWDVLEQQVSQKVSLWLPANKCRFVQG